MSRKRRVRPFGLHTGLTKNFPTREVSVLSCRMTDQPNPRSLVPADVTAASDTPATHSADHGWTRQKQAAFLRELAATHNVSAAARSVGMSRQTAYRLRARLKGEPFDKAWDAAFHSCFDALAQAALERAIHGVEVPHFHGGELVGTSRRFDERLTVALLAMRHQFGRPLPHDRHPASAFDAEELGALIERVERGPDDWLEDSNVELDTRYAMPKPVQPDRRDRRDGGDGGPRCVTL